MRKSVNNLSCDTESIANKGFENWTDVNPDDWVVVSDTAYESEVEKKFGNKSLRLVINTSTVQVYQDINPYDQFKGKSVRLSCFVKTSLVNQSHIGLDDGMTITYSDYHPGNGGWVQLFVRKSISASATRVRVILETVKI